MKTQKLHLCFPVSFSFLLLTLAALQGCAVIAVADTVGTVAVKTVGLAADAAIGVVKISGKAVGAAADAVIPESK
jgi:hypothetical protein